ARVSGRLAGAAMVAAERAVSVQGEGDVAVRAAPGRAAGAAVQRGSDAAPVEEEDRLAASFREPAQLGEERRGERVARLLSQVADPHDGERRGDPPAELE